MSRLFLLCFMTCALGVACGRTSAEDLSPQTECEEGQTRVSDQRCPGGSFDFVVEQCVDGKWEELDSCEEGCADDTRQPSDRKCGLNNNGTLIARCDSGEWRITAECEDPDVCVNGTDQFSDTSCGTNDEGFLIAVCRDGQWVVSDDCSVTPDYCATNGETRNSEPGICEYVDGCDQAGEKTDEYEECIGNRWVEKKETIACTRNTDDLECDGTASKSCQGGECKEIPGYCAPIGDKKNSAYGKCEYNDECVTLGQKQHTFEQCVDHRWVQTQETVACTRETANLECDGTASKSCQGGECKEIPGYCAPNGEKKNSVFGECDYADACDIVGDKQHTFEKCIDHRWVTTAETVACTRDTDDLECGGTAGKSCQGGECRDKPGYCAPIGEQKNSVYGDCEYADECDTSGEKQHTFEQCIDNRWVRTQKTLACTRDTDDLECGGTAGKSCQEGVCVEIEGYCDRNGSARNSELGQCHYNSACRNSGEKLHRFEKCIDHKWVASQEMLPCKRSTLDARCDDGILVTINDVCRADEKCAGVDYCSLYDCARPLRTGTSLCFDNEAVIPCPGLAGSAECASTPWCGQDAQYTLQGSADRFEIVGNVVQDSWSSLAWQAVYQDSENIWEYAMDWHEANDFCGSLVLDGYDDWRLPSATALESLTDYGGFDLATDFPGMLSEIGGGGIWSRNVISHLYPYRWDPISGMLELTGDELDSFVGYSGPAFTLCARGEWPTDHNSGVSYRDPSGRDVVYVHATGLHWKRVAVSGQDGAGHDWKTALSTCEGLDNGEFSDWRLPSARELFGASFTSDLFGILLEEKNLNISLWSSTTYASSTDLVWHHYRQHLRPTSKNDKKMDYWCVRSDDDV